MTIDQLNALSENELILAVAVKSGIKHDLCEMTGIVDIDGPRGLSFERYNPLTNPSHYMPIAIEHGIDIDFAGDKVYCEWEEKMYFPKAQTGRAICTAFLLMNQEPV